MSSPDRSTAVGKSRELFRGLADVPATDLQVFEIHKFKLFHWIGKRDYKTRFLRVLWIDQEKSGLLEVYRVDVDSSSGVAAEGELSFSIPLPQGKVHRSGAKHIANTSSLAGTARKRREVSINLIQSTLPSMRFYLQNTEAVDDFYRSIRIVGKRKMAAASLISVAAAAASTSSTAPSTDAESSRSSPSSATAASSGSLKYGWNVGSSRALPAARLETMRKERDDIGDACFLALQILGLSADTFVDAVARRQENAGLIASWRKVAAIDTFLKQVYAVPDYVDAAELVEGQMVFLRNSSIAFMALLYFSLIGGFSAPEIVKVLDATAYMTRNESKTWKRLNETTEFVLDCMDAGCLAVGASGWRSALRIRFIHCRVRLMLERQSWDSQSHGPPINQEHMMGTLLSFSVNIIEAINKHGRPLTEKEEASYLHLWRYIGYLLGVREVNNPLSSSSEARGAMEAIVEHLLRPDDRSAELAAHVLHSVADKEPFWWSYSCHCECARRMLGDELADALHIERSGPCFFYLIFIFWILHAASTLFSQRLTSHAHRGVIRTRTAIRRLVNRAIGKEAAL